MLTDSLKGKEIMKLKDKDEFIKYGLEHLQNIYDEISKLESFKVDNCSDTVLVIMDMVNGFVKEGKMSSPRMKNIIDPIVDVKSICDENGVSTIAFCDCHTNDSVEFFYYPKHCMEGTRECEIIDELKGVYVINKNSTNGFLEREFLEWQHDNEHICNFIVVGDCTDICVKQFAITLKTWFNMNNRECRIIVPINAIETYDSDLHNADFVNVISIYDMMQSGVEVVKNIVRS